MKTLKIVRSNNWPNLLGFVCLLNVVNGSTALDYLETQPTFLTPCKITDSNNNVCLAKNIESFFTHWKEVAPGLNNFDPQHTKRLQMAQTSENINLKMSFRNIVLTGLSNAVVKKASISDDFTFKYLVKHPSLNLKANYRMKGTVLLLNLNITGDMELKASDLEVLYVLKSRLIEFDNQKFFDTSNIQLSITKIGSSHFDFKNVPNDSADLTKTVQDLLNQNWNDIFDLLRPAIERTLQPGTLKHFKTIFRYIPAKYFVKDLPVN